MTPGEIWTGARITDSTEECILPCKSRKTPSKEVFFKGISRQRDMLVILAGNDAASFLINTRCEEFFSDTPNDTGRSSESQDEALSFFIKTRHEIVSSKYRLVLR